MAFPPSPPAAPPSDTGQSVGVVLLLLGLLLLVAVVSYVLVILFRPAWLGGRRREPVPRAPENGIPQTQLRPFAAAFPGVVLKT